MVQKSGEPVDIVDILFFTGFYTSQVVQDFFHQQYHWCLLFQCAIDFTRKDSYPKKMNMDTQQKSTIFLFFCSFQREKNKYTSEN